MSGMFTNAISVSLISWSNMSMVGKTYSIFQIASNKLGDELKIWIGKENDPSYQVAETLAVEQAKFVLRIENILPTS